MFTVQNCHTKLAGEERAVDVIYCERDGDERFKSSRIFAFKNSLLLFSPFDLSINDCNLLTLYTYPTSYAGEK